MPDVRGRAADLRDALRLAARDLERLVSHVRTSRPRIDRTASPLEVFGAGALVHGYYTQLERFFARVARDLNTAPLDGPDWHRRLLLSMTLDRPGVRPAVVGEDLASRLDELLRFRHVFRNLYVLDLAPGRIADLLDGVLAAHQDVVAALASFEAFLDAVAAAG